MKNIGLQIPEFLKLDESTQKKIIEDVSNSAMVEHEKRSTIESMIFLRDFQKRLKVDPHITLKQIKRLFATHAEKIKKILLTY